jgi:transposase
MLLTRGARSVLRPATAANSAGRTCTPLRSWELAVQQGSNHNKAACALANKLARICYATLRDHQRFDEQQPLARKLNRQAFAMPA